jgi:hypothetical protein
MWSYSSAIRGYLRHNEVHHLVAQLASSTREPAVPAVELQQQRERQLRRSIVLARQLVGLARQQRPVLDPVSEVLRKARHRSTSFRRDHPQGHPAALINFDPLSHVR